MTDNNARPREITTTNESHHQHISHQGNYLDRGIAMEEKLKGELGISQKLQK